MQTIKIGDVVQLKSGGVKMVVQSFCSGAWDGFVFCVWQDSSGTHFEKQYHPDTLTIINE